MPNRRKTDSSQLSAVMWNGARVREMGEHRLEVDFRDGNDWLWDRAPHAVKFTTTIDHFIEAGYVDLNSSDRSTYWSHRYGHSPFDRTLVKEDRKEFRHTRQYILQSADLREP